MYKILYKSIIFYIDIQKKCVILKSWLTNHDEESNMEVQNGN